MQNRTSWNLHVDTTGFRCRVSRLSFSLQDPWRSWPMTGSQSGYVIIVVSATDDLILPRAGGLLFARCYLSRAVNPSFTWLLTLLISVRERSTDPLCIRLGIYEKEDVLRYATVVCAWVCMQVLCCGGLRENFHRPSCTLNLFIVSRLPTVLQRAIRI